MDIGSSDLFKNSRKTGVTAASHTPSELVTVRKTVSCYSCIWMAPRIFPFRAARRLETEEPFGISERPR
jgi:hypothetical protein